MSGQPQSSQNGPMAAGGGQLPSNRPQPPVGAFQGRAYPNINPGWGSMPNGAQYQPAFQDWWQNFQQQRPPVQIPGAKPGQGWPEPPPFPRGGFGGA